MARFDGRVAVVTGGASGIGRSTVLRFLDEGARVVAADLNDANGEQLLADATKAGCGDRVVYVRTDVADEADIEAMIDTATSRFGGLDVLFNNAGVGGAFGPVTEVDVEDWDYTYAVLVRGVFLGIKHGAAVMKSAGGGSIINTASVAGLIGGGAPTAYSSAKAAVINLTMNAAVQLAPWRIRVNAICPGAIMTPLAMGKMPSQQAIESFSQLQPWPDPGLPEDIAAGALFLGSDDARFITGQHLIIDGGIHAQGTDLQGRMTSQGAPTGFVGVNKGTTGQKAIVRKRPT